MFKTLRYFMDCSFPVDHSFLRNCDPAKSRSFCLGSLPLMLLRPFCCCIQNTCYALDTFCHCSRSRRSHTSRRIIVLAKKSDQERLNPLGICLHWNITCFDDEVVIDAVCIDILEILDSWSICCCDNFSALRQHWKLRLDSKNNYLTFAACTSWLALTGSYLQIFPNPWGCRAWQCKLAVWYLEIPGNSQIVRPLDQALTWKYFSSIHSCPCSNALWYRQYIWSAIIPRDCIGCLTLGTARNCWNAKDIILAQYEGYQQFEEINISPTLQTLLVT